jgi:hypothetical protein
MTPSDGGSFGNPERRIQSFGDLNNASLSINRAQQTVPAIELHQRLRFLFVDFEPFGDGMLVIIRALKKPMRAALFRTDLVCGTAAPCRAHIKDAPTVTTGAPAGNSPHELRAINLHQHDGVERLAELGEHGIESRRLLDVARKAIENEPLSDIDRGKALGDDAEHNLILHETARIHGGLGLRAKRGACCNRSAQKIPGRDLWHAPFLRQTLRLGALARARRTQENNSHIDETAQMAENGRHVTGAFL